MFPPMPAPFTALKPGDAVGVVAPANWIEPERLAAGVAEIERAGFRVVVAPQARQQQGRFAGTHEQRAEALEAMFTDRSVKAIIVARGGYGCQYISPALDYEHFGSKPLIGYSDVTTLLNRIPDSCGLPTLHGPMLVDLTRENDPANWQHLWALLRGERLMPTDHPAAAQARVMVEGRASGRLFGGNLAVMAADCGTHAQVKAGGGLLFIEEVNEDLYRFDRLLLQLVRSGAATKITGLVVGELAGVEDKGLPAFGTDAEGIIRSHFGGLGIPVVTNFPAGHGRSKTVLPIGTDMALEAAMSGVKISHSALFA